MKKLAAVGLLATCSVLFAACSGGGGGSSVPSAGTTSPQSANQQPSSSNSASSPNSATASGTSTTAGSDFSRGLASGDFAPACTNDGPGTAHCLSFVVKNMSSVDPSIVAASPLPPGYGPADLQQAYNTASAVAATSGWTPATAPTVAIVDAFHDAYAATELSTYRNTYGLPPCTQTNGCFRWIDQNGNPITSSNHPPVNTGWALEIALDLDMVSANCPYCNIMLVEATSNSFADLAAAVDRAALQPGVKVISNSYGGGEDSSETTLAPHYNHPGIAITASTGDNGYQVQVPAGFNTVVAVGGTTLRRGGTPRGWTETAWSGAGSGCSLYITKPAWQHDPGCPRRTNADVSADANPYTGAAVYSVYSGGFIVVGGTSEAAPLIAALYGLAYATLPDYPAKVAYANPSQLFDITGGSNGSCYPAYLCQGVVGYDGPTGLGTPNGIGAF